MKKILVISDNPVLASFFAETCANQGVSKFADIAYNYSAINTNPSAMIELGAEPIDVKNPKFVATAKDTYDLIFSIHCKQIFPADLVRSVVCINVHPGLNPYNRGWYPQVFSIINGKPIGATIHIMDEYVDHGPIIDQISVEARSSDTSADLYARVIQAEKNLIEKNLKNIISGKFNSITPPNEGNYNSIENFRSLCHLNLETVGTLRDHINLLRGLTHGEFRNAYFSDEYGKKIFIRISLEEITYE